MEAWQDRKPTTATIKAPTGEIVGVRPIDPEFWDEPGNIEIWKYFAEHDRYLTKKIENEEVVYHYTNIEALHGIVSTGTIWASDVRQLNDRAELSYALQQMRALIAKQPDNKIGPQPLNAVFGSGRVWQFATCFSRSRDQLSQWRAYGAKAGVAIGFDRDHLACVAKAHGGSLLNCRYFIPDEFSDILTELAPIRDALAAPGALDDKGLLTEMSLQNDLTRRVVSIAASIKHPSFFEEKETRLVFAGERMSNKVQFRSSPQSLIPFMKIDLDGRRLGIEKRQRYANHLGIMEVIVWPSNFDDQVLDAIDMLFHDVKPTLLTRSISPYRT